MTEFEREYELISELLLNEQMKDRVNAVLEQKENDIRHEIAGFRKSDFRLSQERF